ncbi:MAG: HAD-IC family P-type ATPase [Gemmataceae bacterium]|nr:HAD-IC family P-type ATPase [Gemmataceae bacterium]
MNQTQLRGLTAAEVAERVRRGQVNRTPRSEWKAYARIVARNLFTWFNAMVVPAAVALVALHEYQGGIAVSGMAVANTLIGLVQEIRAKRHLDRLAILVESRARVVRDGVAQAIPAGAVVLGDCILLAAGDAVVADGPVLDARFLEVDEALLTGESDPVRRQPGDRLLSGSVCVAGEGAYRAEKVGGEAFAQHTSAQARRYHYTASPLTRVIDRLIQILSVTAVVLCLIYTTVYLLTSYHDVAAVEYPDLIDARPREAERRVYVRMVAATITSMVPQGLVLTATLAFTIGAVVMSRRGAVVQRLHAVEAMAAVDVVCTDKTGTLTTNRLELDRVAALGGGPGATEVRRLLSVFASVSIDQNNKNIQALRAALGEARADLLDQMPFKSQNRYSAVRVRDGEGERVLVMGACEALRPHLRGSGPDGWEATWKELMTTGLRVLMFAESDHRAPFVGTLDGFPLRPLALVALSDELRPEAGAVLEKLADQGITFKVISGDNPETVRATVAHLNLPLAHEPVVTGDMLESAPDRDELIEQRSVFGRVSPQQKVAIVQTLKERGRFVAMIGDGVNDVLPIKNAQLGIAMGEGSQASKAVAGLVLENNDFALLPETLEEGRTIVRNLRRSAKLFLTKNVYSLFLLLPGAVGLLGLPFPYVPQQVTLLNWLVIGMPALAIALSRERSQTPTRTDFLREVGWFALRTGVVFALAGLVVLVFAMHVWAVSDPEQTVRRARTFLLTTLVLLGITALFRALRDGESQPLLGDRRFRWVMGAAVPVYLLAMYWPPAQEFFQLAALDLTDWTRVLGIALPAWALSVLSDRIPYERVFPPPRARRAPSAPEA